MKIYNLNQALEMFAEIDPQIPIQGIRILLAFAQEEGNNLAYYERRTKESTSSLSRWAAYWGDIDHWLNGRERKGQGLITVRPDPKDRRYKMVFMTPKGKRFFSQLTAL
jgi:hypothetical protein